MSIAPRLAHLRQGYASPGLVDAQVRSGLTDEERAVFDEVRRGVQNADALALLWTDETRAWLTESTICRYCRARKWEAAKAVHMLVETIKWRAASQPGKVTYADVRGQADSLANVVHGFDAVGHVVVYMKVSLDGDGTAKEKLDNIIHNLEECTRQMDATAHLFPGVERLTYIVDLRGFSMKNSGRDMKVAKEWLHILGNHMPERLYKAYLLNYPTAFKIFWGMLKAFVDPVTKAKVHWVPHEAREARRAYFVSEGIEPAWFEEEYGGDLLPLTYCNCASHPSYTPFFDSVPVQSRPLLWAAVAAAAMVAVSAEVTPVLEEPDAAAVAAVTGGAAHHHHGHGLHRRGSVTSASQRCNGNVHTDGEFYTIVDADGLSVSELSSSADMEDWGAKESVPQPLPPLPSESVAVDAMELTLTLRRPQGDLCRVTVLRTATVAQLCDKALPRESRKGTICVTCKGVEVEPSTAVSRYVQGVSKGTTFEIFYKKRAACCAAQ